MRHSGGERRRCTSATVTLYLEVELSSERRPGTEQKTSLGFTTPPKSASLLMGMEETALLLDLERDTGPAGREEREVRVGRGQGAERPARPGAKIKTRRGGKKRKKKRKRKGKKKKKTPKRSGRPRRGSWEREAEGPGLGMDGL